MSAKNVSFKNVEAIDGGVGYVSEFGRFSCFNCTFEDNFGLLGSVLNIFDNGRLNLTEKYSQKQCWSKWRSLCRRHMGRSHLY